MNKPRRIIIKDDVDPSTKRKHASLASDLPKSEKKAKKVDLISPEEKVILIL